MISIQTQKQIEQAVDILKHSGVAAIPTETVYGLAGNVFDLKAIQKIFEIKKRPFFDPLIVHIGDLNQIQDVVSTFPDLAQFLAQTFWPGPLTMVLPKNSKIDSTITSGLPSVGVRFPQHPVAQKIILQLGAPLAAPSANLFGKTSPTTAEHVRSEFQNSVFVVDGGACEIGLESTVVGFDESFKVIKIHRPGAITQKMLEVALVNYPGCISVLPEISNVAPGHLKHHYMPHIPLVILENGAFEMHKTNLQNQLQLKNLDSKELVLSADPVRVARELYSQLRDIAQSGATMMYVYKNKNHQDELWTAIWDRLEKAATLKI